LRHALSVRCLQLPEGSLAENADADPEDLVAIVGRSY